MSFCLSVCLFVSVSVFRAVSQKMLSERGSMKAESSSSQWNDIDSEDFNEN